MSPGWICSHSDSQKNQRRFVFSVDVCPGLIRELRDVCSVSASADGERTCGPWERWDPRLFVRAPCAPGARERKCPPGVGHTHRLQPPGVSQAAGKESPLPGVPHPPTWPAHLRAQRRAPPLPSSPAPPPARAPASLPPTPAQPESRPAPGTPAAASPGRRSLLLIG